MRASAIFRTLRIPRKRWEILLIFVLCLVLSGTSDLRGADSHGPKVSVFVSRDIRPYVEAVEGLSAVLAENANAKIDILSFDKVRGKSRDLLIEKRLKENPDLFIAIGPEAVKAVSEDVTPESPPWMYSMILNPPEVSDKTEAACGVPLDIPAHKQLEMVALGLPAVKCLGLIYDPRFNTDFFANAVISADFYNLDIVPLAVSSKKDIPTVLKANWGKIDALWLIPDQTVISESIVQYIIKESLFRETPVIGYNQFFYESGAALAFVFDYRAIGRQTGRMAVDVLTGKKCQKDDPVFRVWQNIRVFKKLEISVPETRTPPIEAGP